MADEFFRPYFGTGVWATASDARASGTTATVANNNSALGITAVELDRKFTRGGSVWWMPTTNEFGPRGAYGDWEWHEELATRFGVSATYSPEQAFRASTESNPENTTLRLADSVNLFDTGALAPGRHHRHRRLRDRRDRRRHEVPRVLPAGRVLPPLAGRLRRRRAAAGARGRGQGLLRAGRVLSRSSRSSSSTPPRRRSSATRTPASATAPSTSSAANYYFDETRNHRLNVQLMDVNRSPVSSTFGYYVGGQDGFTGATALSIFF